MTTYYQLLKADKVDGKVPPGLDGTHVKNKAALFGFNEVSANDFYKTAVSFDFFVPKDFGDPEPAEGPQIICDLHQWRGEYPIGGQFMPISEKLQKLFQQFGIQKYRFYPAKVLFKERIYPYAILQLLMNDFEQYIDYTKTLFNNMDIDGDLTLSEKKVLQFDSFEDMENHSDDNWDFNWNYEKIVMKTIFRDIDLIYLPQLNEVVSERLKIAIEEAGITGVEFEELPIPIEFSDEV